MKKFVIAIPVILMLGACATAVKMEDHTRVVQELRDEINELQLEVNRLQDVESQKNDLKTKMTILQMKGDHYQELSDELKHLLDELKKDGVTYSPKGGWTFQTDVLFQPGSSILSKKGEASLVKFAKAWKSKGVKFNIVGHTDKTPIKNCAKDLKTDTNMELGMVRSLAVFDFLKKHGIDESRMSITSKGSTEPISKDNGKNRRVAIFVLK